MDVKKCFLFLLIIAVLFPLWAQQEKDVVLVVDTASSMFSYYNEVGTYLSGPFLAENVADGDTLHIISYGSKPRFEIARKILGTGDIETAGARIWLLYPLEPSSDSGAAISYAENYVKSIQGGRPKKVFIVSDTDLSAQADAAAGRLSPTEVRFIRAGSRMGSGTAIASAGTAQRQSAASTAPARTAAQTTAPAAVARTPAAQPARAAAGTAQTASPSSNTAGAVAAPAVPDSAPEPSVAAEAAAGTTAAETAAAAGGAAAGALTGVPDNAEAAVSNTLGAAGSPAAVGTAGGTAGNANTGTSAQTASTGTAAAGVGSLGIPLPLLIALILLLLLGILLFIIFRMRSLHSSPKKAMAEYRAGGNAADDAALLNSFASRQAEASLQGPRQYHHRNNTNQFLTTPPMLNIFVEEQNTGIGRRNIHALKQGATYSVGGGNSDFLIFLVKFPSHIGRLSFDGSNCTFTPLKSEFFPDIGSSPVTECIGKTIRIISKMGYEVFFHFEPYRDPLLVMNELLNSIKVPEPPAAREA